MLIQEEVKKQIDAGFTKQEIQTNLTHLGYTPEDISNALINLPNVASTDSFEWNGKTIFSVFITIVIIIRLIYRIYKWYN